MQPFVFIIILNMRHVSGKLNSHQQVLVVQHIVSQLQC
jgi:hypothetical protein